MKKSVRRIACLLLSMVTAFSFVGCFGGGDKESSGSVAGSSASAGTTSSSGSSNDTSGANSADSSSDTSASNSADSSGTVEKKYDTETRPVVFATEALDGNFNPFFATSGTDTEMISMTQLGMLTTDEKGTLVCGEDEPTVALTFKETTTGTGDDQMTDYEFVIKNGIKFSDGSALTIKDVLFNLYVYLDPSYMGSATMYSTDIVGLKQYRAQDPDLNEDNFSESDLNQRFYADAIQRRNDILNYLDPKEDEGFTAAQIAVIKADIETVKKLFKEEVESDWTMNQGGLESYQDEYTFTEDWQVYYLVEGLIKPVVSQGKPLKDVNGKYITNITPAGAKYKVNGKEYTYDSNDGLWAYNEELVKGITDAMNDPEKLAVYTSEGVPEAEAKGLVAKDYAIKTVYDAYAIDAGIDDIITFWATGSNILDKFVAEARTKFYEDKKQEDGSLIVPTITGITTSKKDIDGESHDVLNIKINGVDPKAKYNFSFGVAPMNYYSGAFNGVDYIAKADGRTNFGVAFNNNEFFEAVLQDENKNKKPVGAGPYQVSDKNGSTTDVSGSAFYSNNWVYFARNEYFDTVGEGIDNAKIKYLRYKVVNTDQIIQSLQSKEIDVGEPNATATNITNLGKISHLNQKSVATNGYGYVGINPKYVEDIEVRRAIMMTLDPINCLNYYTSANASILYRSMSKESWIWNYIPDATRHDSVAPASGKQEILDLVAEAGWKPNASGKLVKGSKTLKFTFTIAGATTDHPAYQMFMRSAEKLNSYGFDITVTTDISALKKLATGQLEVWAAAWSSTIDPDMYQVYHKDSKATSVNNWGYPTILNDTTGQFEYEQGIIDDLSLLIEQGRETNNEQTRAGIYSQALDLVMELAVEFPTYQRNDCVAYNKEVINPASLNQEATAFAGVIDKIWELDYN